MKSKTGEGPVFCPRTPPIQKMSDFKIKLECKPFLPSWCQRYGSNDHHESALWPTVLFLDPDLAGESKHLHISQPGPNLLDTGSRSSRQSRIETKETEPTPALRSSRTGIEFLSTTLLLPFYPDPYSTNLLPVPIILIARRMYAWIHESDRCVTARKVKMSQPKSLRFQMSHSYFTVRKV